MFCSVQTYGGSVVDSRHHPLWEVAYKPSSLLGPIEPFTGRLAASVAGLTTEDDKCNLNKTPHRVGVLH